MSTNDREDALARALDLLAGDDPARSDPRLVRDPHLAAEARSSRETAARVWLAVSPLRAAPGDVLPGIMENLAPVAAPAGNRRWTRFALASGWAAAAAIALAWFMLAGREDATSPPGSADVIPAPVVPGVRPASEGNEAPSDGMPTHRADRDRQHYELARLRRALAAALDDGGATLRPRVMELSAPGSARAHDPDAARDRLMALLANALRGELEEHAADPATLVIERGWLAAGELRLGDEEWLRHRNFPEETWHEHALMKSDDGRFFDPASGLLWEKDPASTDYIGRRATADTDLSAFIHPDEPDTHPEWHHAESRPAGFVIEDPATGRTHLLVEGLQPLSGQETSDGSAYHFVADTGRDGRISIPLDLSPGNGGAASTSFNAPGGLGEFSVVLSDGGGGESVIISGGD